MIRKISNVNNDDNLFLALTSDESFWDVSKEIVFLGEEVCSWTSKYYNPEKILLPEFWEDEERITDAIEFTNIIYENVLKKLTLYLNEIHDLEKDTLYWRRIIGYFLKTYIDTMYDKYLRVKKVLKSYPNITVAGLSQSSFNTSDNAFHFVQAIRESDTLNLQLFTQVLNALDHKMINKKVHPFSLVKDAKKIKRDNARTLKNFIVRQMQKLINKGVYSKVSLYVSLFNNKSLLSIIWGSRFKCWPILFMDSVEQNVKINDILRNKLISIKGENSFEDMIYKTLTVNMPTDFIEGFSNIHNKALSHIHNNVPKAIVTGIGFFWDSNFSVWAAECAERGSILYGMQHGGTYGEVKYISIGESFERSLTNFYITWGWQKDETTIPMAPSRLIGLKKQNLDKNDNILWITTADSRHVSFIGTIVFGSRFAQYFKHQTSLYRHLVPEVKEKIYVRLYPDDFGWKLKERWLERDRTIHFSDSKESLTVQAQKYKLIVIDHFGGTSTLECLRLGIPLIIVGNKKLFTLDSGARRYYKLLEDVNVLFFDTYSASKMINIAYKDVDEWWNESKRQEAIESFLAHFAQSSEKPLKDWNYLIREISEGNK